MDDSEHTQLVRLIRARINHLEALLKSIATTQEKLSDQQKDGDSRNDILAQAPVDNKVFVKVKNEINQLRVNLEWLDHEHAGECEECGCSIPLKRLMAVPDTRLCVDCASQRED